MKAKTDPPIDPNIAWPKSRATVLLMPTRDYSDVTECKFRKGRKAYFVQNNKV